MRPFSWATGWLATAAGVLGALTATDTLPTVTAVLAETVGTKAAHVGGLVLTLVSLVVAKHSHSTKPSA